MTWLSLAIGGALAGAAAGLLRMWAARLERRFWNDASRVAAARKSISNSRWMPALARVGAAAGLVTLMAMMGLVTLLICLFLAGVSEFRLNERPVAGALIFGLLGALVTSAFVALPAAFLCRCAACAGFVFDDAKPARKGFTGALRENWRVLTGQGRCPRCDAPLYRDP